MPERTGTAAANAAHAGSEVRPFVERLLPLDWLRGLVMMLMAVDHVDAATNPRHSMADSATAAGHTLSPPDFLTRWCTHLCAPTFLLLCERGETARAFDRHLFGRGVVLLLIEATFLSFIWRSAEGIELTSLTPVFLQVLYALGVGMMLMVPLRRLSGRAQVILATLLLLGVEVAHRLTLARGSEGPFLLQLLVTGGSGGWGTGAGASMPHVIVIYPVLAWLPVMLLGHVLGWAFVHRRVTPRVLLMLASWSLVLFVALRWRDGFGNMALHRRSGELLEWLHCSKYPPSITFFAMELCLAFLLLAGLVRAANVLVRLPKWNPIEVLGQTALFFYLLHLPMIGALLAIGVLPGDRGGSAPQSWLGALFVVLACWPICAAYRCYKQRWRHAWTRYL